MSMLLRVVRFTAMAGLLVLASLVPGPYAVTAAVLALAHGVLLYGPKSPAAHLIVWVASVGLVPVCVEAAGAGAAAVLAVLPLLVGVQDALRQMTGAAEGPPPGARLGWALPLGPGRRATLTSHALLVAAIATIALGLVAGRWVLVGSGVSFLAWHGALMASIVRRVPHEFIRTVPATLRAVVSAQVRGTVALSVAGTLPLAVRLRSPVPWAQAQPDAFVAGRADTTTIHLSLTPPLAGPSQLALEAVALDPWGLVEIRTAVEVATLRIIPRAQYASWLARRFLEHTSGTTSPVLAASASTPRGRRGGIEYRGSRMYEPGDTLRMVNWKHTAKLRELVVNEFNDPAAQTAVVIVGLQASDPDGTDRLAFHLVTTVLTLAREGVPAVLAAYTDHEVMEVTSILAPREAVKHALRLSDWILRVTPEHRTLDPPKLSRLRRWRRVVSGTGPAGRLADLIGLEIQELVSQAAAHPAGRAARQAAARVRPPATLVAISVTSLGAAALAAALEQLQTEGYRSVSVTA